MTAYCTVRIKVTDVQIVHRALDAMRCCGNCKFVQAQMIIGHIDAADYRCGENAPSPFEGCRVDPRKLGCDSWQGSAAIETVLDDFRNGIKHIKKRKGKTDDK